MAPPRKREGAVTAFTYRCETPKWRKFCAVATLLGRSPGSFFDETVNTILDKNRITIETSDSNKEPLTGIEATRAAIAEIRAGKGKTFDNIDDLMADLHNDDED